MKHRLRFPGWSDARSGGRPSGIRVRRVGDTREPVPAEDGLELRVGDEIELHGDIVCESPASRAIIEAVRPKTRAEGDEEDDEEDDEEEARAEGDEPEDDEPEGDEAEGDDEETDDDEEEEEPAGEPGRGAEYPLAFSSETPVVRMSWWGESWTEILGHGPGEVDMARFQSGRAAVFEEHIPPNVGVIRSASIDDDAVGRATIRFSRTRRGRDVEMDFMDDVRTLISVGYMPRRAQLVDVDDEKGETWRITLWEPVELSVVGVPADATVGKGRSQGARRPNKEERMLLGRKSYRMDRVPGAGPGAGGHASAGEVEAARKARNAEIAEIHDFAEANGLMETAEGRAQVSDWVGRELSPGEAALELAKSKRTKGNAQPPRRVMDELPAKDRERYSYARALLAGLDVTAGRSPVGLEGEVHVELTKRRPENWGGRGGILVPMDTRVQKRALQSDVPGKGSELIGTELPEIIEQLRNDAFVVLMGARLLTGLTGHVAFPKKQGASTIYWIGENSGTDTPESDIDLGIVNMAPKGMSAVNRYSRQLLATASFDVERMVREDLAEGHVLAADRAVPHGLGSAGQPTGIYLAPDVQVQAMGGSPSYGLLVDMLGKVAKQNASRGRLGFLTTPMMAAYLKQTLEFGAGGGVNAPIWRGPFDDGEVAGYPARATNQISDTMSGSAETGGTEHGIIFGNWAEVVIGMWEGFELLVDPYTEARQAMVRAITFQMIDHILRHGESFCKATGATRP